MLLGCAEVVKHLLEEKMEYNTTERSTRFCSERVPSEPLWEKFSSEPTIWIVLSSAKTLKYT